MASLTPTFITSGPTYNVEVATSALAAAPLSLQDNFYFQVAYTPAANGQPASFVGTWSSIANGPSCNVASYCFVLIGPPTVSTQAANQSVLLNASVPATTATTATGTLQDQSPSVLTPGTNYQAVVYALGTNQGCSPMVALSLTTPAT